MENNPLFDEVRALLRSFAESKQLSQNALAKMLGVSAATLSNISHGNSHSVKDSMLLQLKGKIRPQSWQIISTTNFATVQDVCNNARQFKRLSCIIGEPGLGKTTALRSYYKQNPNTYMVTCKKVMTPKRFFELMQSNIGINFGGTTHEVIMRIAEEMNKQYEPLIIIDEIGRISPKTLTMLHDLWDEIDTNAGIVLAGVGYFKTNLEKAVLKNKVGMPEINSRIGNWQYLTEPTRAEIKAVCAANGLTDESKIKSIINAKDFREVSQVIKNAAHDNE